MTGSAPARAMQTNGSAVNGGAPATDADVVVVGAGHNGLVAALGRHAESVQDAPGLVLGRIVAQLVNEAAFLIGEGNGTPEDVDAGMELGVNHPIGTVKRSQAMGVDHALATLDALHSELGEERYRAAPLLRRRA